MRRSVLSILALVVLGLGLVSCGGGEAEKPLTPFKGEGFSVSMPGKPKRTTNSTPTAAGDLKIVQYTSEGSDRAYTVGFTDIPGGANAALAEVVQGAAAAVKGTVQDEVDSLFQNYKSRDARITNAKDSKGNQVTVFLRALLVGDRLYQLQYLQKGADIKAPPTEYLEFLKSLTIG